MNFSKFFISFTIIFFGFLISLSAHDRTIRGIVHDKNDKPIPSATIRLENTMLGTIANKQGEFMLRRIPDGKFRLAITAVGYEPYYHTIEFEHEDGDDMDLNITMFESVIFSGNVVVTATRSDKIYEDVPVKVSVIDDKIFTTSQSVALRDGLRFQPGLRVEANCQNCGFTQVRLNGLEGRYSQILIDSRPIFSSLNGLYGLDQIPANMIDRVEVVRGGGSSLYGGNAIGGIINIITRKPEESNFEASYLHGFIDGRIPDRSMQLSGSSVTQRQDAGVYLFGNFHERNPWDANGDGFTESSLLKENSFGARAFYAPTAYSKLSLDFHSIGEFRRGGDQLELPPHEVMMAEELTHDIHGGGLTYEQYFNRNLSKLSAYTSVNFTNRRNYTGIEMDPRGYGKTNNSVYVGGLMMSHAIEDAWIGSNVLTFGAEYQYDNVINEATGYRTSLNQTTRLWGFYFQTDWLMTDKFSLLTGARIDKHNFVENPMINPRLTAMYKATKDLTFRGNLTTGYRAPQAYDEDLHESLRSGTRMIILLDPDLKEERSFGYSFSGDYTYYIDELPISLSLEYFNTRLLDVFVNEETGIDAAGNIVFTKRNGDGATVQGMTAEFKTFFTYDIQLQTGITYQTSTYDSPILWSEGDETEGIPEQTTSNILRTPNLYGYLTLFAQITDSWDVNLTGIYTGNMYVPHYAGGIRPDGSVLELDRMTESPDFFELNIQSSLKVFKNPDISLSFGIVNLLNQFQNDFDRGASRDTDYIYGPIRPRTYTFGIKAGI
ncbi:MAG: TonB-dependent receptor [Candidatus Kapabacteria bacterium]|nr:TonB-dependent receptor [Ignavibacteriota bacterium]MCW5883551.1 TonB-dependent receptor [Candidatus Kapabacteria bacterium]